MILLAIDSCLLFFFTWSAGVFTVNFLKKFLQFDIAPDFFEIFLLGLVTSFAWFNMASFFVPVNYLILLPLLAISIIVFANKTVRNYFYTQSRQTARLFFSGRNLFLVAPFLALLFFFWMLPPLNGDSGEYHYIAIRWYEQFKIVPGLANIHGRLAFNPASFIISAAYSFTDIVGQPLYPLNGVLALVFYTWLLKKIITPHFTLYNFVVFILSVLLFRITLINISSPSSDMLSGILLFYCGFRTYELINAGKTATGDYLPVVLICCFSITAKLSAVPSLPLLPFIYFILLKKGKHFSIVIKCGLLMLLIIAPWLARNFILSGYLLYPVPGSNIFYADWAVPNNVVKLDYIFSRYGPRTVTVDFATMQKMNILQLTATWANYMYNAYFVSLIIAIAAILSPFTFLFFRIVKKNIPATSFMLWCIYYLAAWIWFINSPEHRFGLSYLLLAIFLPVFYLLLAAPSKWNLSFVVVIIIICFFCVYYPASIFNKKGVHHFTLSEAWLKPARDHRYYQRNDLRTFPFISLGNGVKLYLPDENHECLNADGPCMNWRYGAIEMRGTKIEDGFRNVKDEVKHYYPFVDLPNK